MSKELGTEFENVKFCLKKFWKSTVSLKRGDNTFLTLPVPLGVAVVYTVWRRPRLRLLALAGAVGASMSHFELEVNSHSEKETDHAENDDFNFPAGEV